MPDLIIVGGGGHAKVVISLVKKMGGFHILGYTDVRDQGPILGVGFIGEDTVLEQLIRERNHCAALVGVGHVRTPDARKRLMEKLSALGFLLPVIISPDAVVNESVSIGEGTVIGDGVVVNSGTRIGRCSIANTHCTIDHDCEIGDCVHVATGATLSGGVKVGHGSLIGAGATVIQYRTIGDDCLIGAGAVVVEDCLLPGSYCGVPARRVQR
jgi:sugar O-acyltransferase (sialic acid O-acetyltransferase NeuD family)